MSKLSDAIRRLAQQGQTDATKQTAATATTLADEGQRTADAAIAAHLAAADPHPQYLMQAEADALYVLASALAELVDDRVAALLVAGSNITLTYNDAANTITVAATGGGSLTDGDKGDITVSSGGTVWTIDADAVTWSKVQNIASGRLLGRSTAGSGDVEEITIGSGLNLSGGTLTATGGGGGGGAPTTARYVVGAADATLTNEIVIPYFNTHPDRLPASAGSLDDEFDAGSLDPKWTWRNQGGATATFANSHIIISEPSVGSGDNYRTLVQTAPATPWTVTAKFTAYFNTGYPAGGLVLRRSGANQLTTFVLHWNDFESRGGFYIFNYTNETTITAGGNLAPNRQASYHGPVYLRITDNGTNLLYSYSLEGAHFRQLVSQARTAHIASGPNQVGIGITARQSETTLVCDWFRQT